MKFTAFHPFARLRGAAKMAIWLAALASGTVFAATTDISNAPLFTSSTTNVKPNIMYVLDDSGSMAWDFLPDDAGTFTVNMYGRRSAHCNGLAYDPTVVYSPPVDATGTPQANGVLTVLNPADNANTATVSNPAYSPSTFTPNLTNITSASGSVTLPSTVGSTFSVSVSSSSGFSATAPNNLVTVYGTSSQFFVGQVSSTTSTTVKGTVLFVVGTGSLSSAKIAVGAANSYWTYTGSQPNLNWQYTSSGLTKNTFYNECSNTVTTSPSLFALHIVSASSTDAQNYANWYAYYLDRITMMKTSMSLAFAPIDARYRVGFTTISQSTATASSKFLSIGDFCDTPSTTCNSTNQKTKFYADLNAVTPGGSTPLRGALAKAGQYYAHKAVGQASTDDPIQYSCQRNYTIMSTDGYWNTGGEVNNSGASKNYGDYQLDNVTAVGQQDGGATPRPMFDGGNSTTTTTRTWTATGVTVTSSSTPTTATTVVTKTTTVQTPVTGNKQVSYTLPVTAMTVSLARASSGATITGTVASTATLGKTGSTLSVVITQASGSSVSGYAGTVNATIASGTTFTYPSTTGSRPTASPSGTFTVQPAWGGGQVCSAGQGVPQQTTTTYDTVNLSTTTNTTTTYSVSAVATTTTTTTTTPYTEIITAVNGVTVSDNTTAGTQTQNSKSTSTNGTPTVTVTPNTSTSTGTATTAPVTTGPVYSGSCVSTAPATTNTTTSPTTTTQTTNTGPTTTGPTTTTGTLVVTAGPTTTTTTTTPVSSSNTVSTGGSSNTLADMAMYYYQTDLRDPSLNNCTGGAIPGGTQNNVCANNVPGSSASAAQSFGDSATWQHMTLFTVGLVSGTLQYSPTYLQDKSGDFFDILNGGKNWPVPTNITSGGPENIDDLWHAAVNGRGQYFMASNPTAVANGLNTALTAIKAVTGSASAASTSSLQPVQGNNFVYVAEFTTSAWTGEILEKTIDPVTGQISATAPPVWSAQAQLDGQTPSARTIYYAAPSAPAALHTFTYANLTLDGYNSYFDNFCSKTGASGSGNPSQCAGLNPAQVATANVGSNLVNYLRGDPTMAEGSVIYYRTRAHVLGDIIDASPLFVGAPNFQYVENNYQTFIANNANRQQVVMGAANDGMLHAFDVGTGNELWAFIPTAVMSNMYKLADNNYSNFHSYYVDGSPRMGDVYVDDHDGNGPHWKTIVVGGLGDGGRTYYALDVTNPAVPKLLWQFSDTNLGLTYGNPIITKRTNGQWVVVFGSGYNNVNPGDGNGRMYVLDANTGALVTQTQTYTSGTTPAGTATTPSGLADLNDWVDATADNTAKRFYGGDLLGNLWRFDLDSQVQPYNAALRLAQLTGPTGVTQPITTKPILASVAYNGGNYPVVYVATGQYLGVSDLTTTAQQTVYAIKDPLTSTALGVVRSRSDFVTQTITASGTNRTSTTNPVNWVTQSGWYTDLPAGERVSVDPQIALTTLYVGSNLPSTDACTVGGQSFLYTFDIGTGSSQSSYVGNMMIQGLTLVQLVTGASNGEVVTIITRSDGSLTTQTQAPSTATANLRRTSWRELVD